MHPCFDCEEGSGRGHGTVAEIVGGEITAVVRAEDDEALRAALEVFPEATSVRASDEGLVVALASDDLAALNRYLAGRGIYVSHLARRHRSLEDAFMDLTGEDGDVGQGSLTEFAS